MTDPWWLSVPVGIILWTMAILLATGSVLLIVALIKKFMDDFF